jgi:hypothetical protein
VDPLQPVRIIDPKAKPKDGVSKEVFMNFHPHYYSHKLAPVFHFGYCIRDQLMHYKWSCHGHKNELRENWLKDVWMRPNVTKNVHPTNGKNDEGVGFWNVQQMKKSTLPAVMRKHPRWTGKGRYVHPTDLRNVRKEK